MYSAHPGVTLPAQHERGGQTVTDQQIGAVHEVPAKARPDAWQLRRGDPGQSQQPSEAEPRDENLAPARVQGTGSGRRSEAVAPAQSGHSERRQDEQSAQDWMQYRGHSLLPALCYRARCSPVTRPDGPTSMRQRVTDLTTRS